MLHHHAFAAFQFIIRRCGAHEHGLAHHALELLEFQRAVVHGAGQSEAILHQVLLAAAIPAVHGAHLAHRHVALIDDHEEVLREIIQQAEGALSGGSFVEIGAVVLDPRAIAQLAHHLQVVVHPLFQPFRFQVFADLFEEGDLLHHIVLDCMDGAVHGIAAGDENVGRVDGETVRCLYRLSVLCIEPFQAFDLVAPEVDAYTFIGVGQVHLHHIATHPEIAAAGFHVLPAVQRAHQLVQQFVAGDLLPLRDIDDGLVELRRIADAVDATDAGHHDDIATPAKQGTGGAQPQFLDLVVDREVFLDVGVRCREVGLGLVVVVVADEILHAVVREEVFELAVELRRERLVVAQDQRRAVHLGDHVGHGEGLSGAGNAEQGLGRNAVLEALHELFDGFGLVAGGLEFGDEFEGHWTDLGGAVRSYPVAVPMTLLKFAAAKPHYHVRSPARSCLVRPLHHRLCRTREHHPRHRAAGR